MNNKEGSMRITRLAPALAVGVALAVGRLRVPAAAAVAGR
jgi:hypothetical protein